MSGGVRSGQPTFPGALAAVGVAAALGALGLLGSLGWQARRLAAGVRLGRRLAAGARPYERHLPPPGTPAGPGRPLKAAAAPRRVLLLGDSTGVGVGAGRPEDSIAGLLAETFPAVAITNRCVNGARTGDVRAQLAPLVAAGERFDLVLVFAGGNDVIRLTPKDRLAADARALLAALPAALAPGGEVVWAGSANVGGSPLLASAVTAPLAWWLERRTHRAMSLLAREATARGVRFVDFCRTRRSCFFARHAGLCFAPDGLHPSTYSYRLCFRRLAREARLAERLGAPAGAGAFAPQP